jgi:hypothetical protein
VSAAAAQGSPAGAASRTKGPPHLRRGTSQAATVAGFSARMLMARAAAGRRRRRENPGGAPRPVAALHQRASVGVRAAAQQSCPCRGPPPLFKQS